MTTLERYFLRFCDWLHYVLLEPLLILLGMFTAATITAQVYHYFW